MTDPTARPEPPAPRPAMELRIGNVEREATVARLQAALGEGRLDIGEFDERLAATYSARTAGDLVPITADLPATGSAAAATPAVAGGRDRPRHHAAGHGAGQLAGGADGRPDRNSRAWLAWAWRAWATAVAINLVIWLAVSLGNGDAAYFWPMWVAGPWGVILLVNTIFAGRAQSGD